ncbi:hypothetical protein EW026_g7861 [Hermanssonia centrifuga]|uniref:Uncharacterized protein n=1 Tax=Hermanssonia centrifuga TaxID=98765 RepID=A0A4S4K6C6_9APHY|nr:hypothetical protein EW026_g7861 [Hermanssonia centrifuga]
MSTVDRRSTVLITGCSADGLGEALALEFHSKGLRVFATARNTEAMKPLQAQGIETFELDVTNSDSIASIRSRIEELTGGKLDILVNNAGISYPYSGADMSMDKVKALFDVNLFAAMAMVQSFLPLLLASNHARIVQMGSLAGVMPVPFGAAYNASKAALHSFGDTLRVELAPFNIKVITLVLGNIQTQLSKPWHRLPENSIYQPIKDIYQSRRIDNFQKSAIPREPLVRDIVKEVLKNNPRAWFWGGANAWVTWFISTFLGRRGFVCIFLVSVTSKRTDEDEKDGIMSKMFGLKKLATLKAQERKSA